MLITEKNIAYKAFGLSVTSEIPLPELPIIRDTEGETDVEIKLGDLSSLWDKLSDEQDVFVVKENLIMFRVPDIATFSVQGGNRITVSLLKNYDQDVIRLYLLGTCMGALLMQRKILPLHGSVVADDTRAYAFIGERGAGKSTLATAFLRKGYRLLSDDVIAVSLSEGNIPYVIPSYPQQKLWQRSLQAFGMNSSEYSPLYKRETKYAVPVHAQYVAAPMPLAGIFELVPGEEECIEIHVINGLQRLQTLFYHTFRSFLIPRLGLMKWHFQYLSRFINQIELLQIRRPKIGFTAEKIVSDVLKHIEKNIPADKKGAGLNDYRPESLVK